MNWLMLGRNGDIMQVLPAIKHEFDKTGEVQRLFVSDEFVSLLDGCSYVEGWELPVKWDNVPEALRLIEQQFPGDHLVNCCIYGKGWMFRRKESNYQRDIWRNTHCPYEFNTLPLIFDRRSTIKGAETFWQFRLHRFTIATHFSSVSSPFPHGRSIIQAIRSAFEDKIDVLDLSDVRANRLYDLLGPLEKCNALVCCDSAMLHLSRAIPSLPVLAFLSDQKKPWNTSEPHSGVIWHSLYSQIAERGESFKSALKSL